MWIEDVEDEDEDRHKEVGAEADKVADRVPAAHLSVNFLESFVDFLCADASYHLSEVQWHSEDQGDWDGDNPDGNDETH
jgi:hypothetical protein